MRVDWTRFQDRIKKREQEVVEKERCKLIVALDMLNASKHMQTIVCVFVCHLFVGQVPVIFSAIVYIYIYYMGTCD